jgi:hypothetical protein
VHVLQAALGNRRVARLLGSASTRRLQRWEDSSWPADPVTTDDQFAGADIGETDAAAIIAAIDSVQEFFKSERPVVVHLGIGVGNPSTKWGNQSGGPKFDPQQQVLPTFLADADAKDKYTVVGLNFNYAGEQAPQFVKLLKTEHRIHLQVSARFPLDEKGPHSRAAMERLVGLAKEAHWLSVMNSVTHNRYPGIVKLLNAAKRKRASYVESYAEQGTRQATMILRPVDRKSPVPVLTHASELKTLEDVFHPAFLAS